jgi:hypothetical protein
MSTSVDCFNASCSSKAATKYSRRAVYSGMRDAATLLRRDASDLWNKCDTAISEL